MPIRVDRLLEPPPPLTPPGWARGGHAQTLWGHVLPSKGPDLAEHPDAKRVELQLSGGDRLVGFFHPGSDASRPIVALFHGLSGDTGADYMRRTAAVALRRGYGVLAMNHRGCGAGRGLATKPYHSGSFAELGAAFEWCRRRHARRAILAVGFSLSGNALLLGLALRKTTLPDAAIAINPPIDLERTSFAMNEGLARLYELRFVARLRRQLESRVRAGRLEAGRYRIPRRASLFQLDQLYTAPAGGFEDAHDYYRRCSAGPRLARIETPTVVISARDDPLVPVEAFERFERSESIHLHLEESGGHLGYVGTEVKPTSGARWLDGALAHYWRQLESLVPGAT